MSYTLPPTCPASRVAGPADDQCAWKMDTSLRCFSGGPPCMAMWRGPGQRIAARSVVHSIPYYTVFCGVSRTGPVCDRCQVCLMCLVSGNGCRPPIVCYNIVGLTSQYTESAFVTLCLLFCGARGWTGAGMTGRVLLSSPHRAGRREESTRLEGPRPIGCQPVRCCDAPKCASAADNPIVNSARLAERQTYAHPAPRYGAGPDD